MDRGTEIIRTTLGRSYVDALVPRLSEDMTPELREGAARRRILLMTGVCPCGARLSSQQQTIIMRRRVAGADITTLGARVRHNGDCPAANPELNELLRAHVGAFIQRVTEMDTPPTSATPDPTLTRGETDHG